MFVSDWRQVSGFLRVIRFYAANRTDRHDIAEILLNVALNTITPVHSFTLYLMTVCK
jgi:hypothetical protein